MQHKGGRAVPGAGSWEPKGACRQVDSTYLAQQQLLADALCGAFANGTKCSSICSSAEQALCPGVSYLSVAVPGPLRESSFLISGNLAADVRAPPAVIPAHKTAAGLAFFERRWFHVSRAVVGGLLDYWDLRQAFCPEGCSSVLCIPITVEPAAWGSEHRDSAMPAPCAVGVLSVGLDSRTVIDAGLLTSAFMLARCMAPRAATLVQALLQARQGARAGLPDESGPHSPSECHYADAVDSCEGEVCSSGLTLRGGGSLRPPCNGSRACAAAVASARKKYSSSKGLDLMIAFATQRAPKGRDSRASSAAGRCVVLAMSCVAFCFLQLSRLKQSRAVMGAVAVCCLIALATLCPLLFPGLRILDQTAPSFS